LETGDERIREAVLNTQILRAPKQSLATFGVTSIYYYLVTEPAYSDVLKCQSETVVREGKVVAQRPRIVTPYYLSRLEGFSGEARKYFEMLIQMHQPDTAGLFYTYRNEPKELSVVSDNLLSVVDKLSREIDKKGDTLTSIIKGEDSLWDVSILKFIYELTKNSVTNNFAEMNGLGLANIDSSGLPVDARMRIEGLFRQVERGETEPSQLKSELDRWNVFSEYQDRFLSIFKKRR